MKRHSDDGVKEQESTPKRTLIHESLQHVGSEIVLNGWVQTVRSHGKIAFLDLRDRSGIIQVGGFEQKIVTIMADLHPQDVIAVRGLVKKRDEKYINKLSATGSIEIEALDIQIITKADQMPFDLGGKQLHLELPTLLDNRSLTLRHATIYPIFIIQEAIAQGFRSISQQLGCIEIFVPTIAA